MVVWWFGGAAGLCARRLRKPAHMAGNLIRNRGHPSHPFACKVTRVTFGGVGRRGAGVLVALTMLLAGPGAALGQSGPANPLAPGLPQSTPSTTSSTPALPVTPTTTTAGDSSVGGGSVVVIAIGALVILAAISFFIWRDARRRAPVRARAGGGELPAGSRSGSKARAKPRKLSPAERKRRKRGRAR